MKDIDPVIVACAGAVASGYGKSLIWSEWARARAELLGDNRRSAGIVVSVNDLERSPRLTGNELDFFLRDELANISSVLIQIFKDPMWADLDVRVVEEQLDRRDPRNRNPRAGKQTIWTVYGAGDPQVFYNKAQAQLHAKNRHKRAVAAANADKHPVASRRA